MLAVEKQGRGVMCGIMTLSCDNYHKLMMGKRLGESNNVSHKDKYLVQ
jgi:hypothetical protein